MALEGPIGGVDNTLFTDEDKRLKLHVKDASGVPVNVAGWAIQFVVRRYIGDLATVISLACPVSGTYDVDPLVNTQRAICDLLSATHLNIAPATYSYSWKRTDTGTKTVLRHGEFIPVKPSQ